MRAQEAEAAMFGSEIRRSSDSVRKDVAHEEDRTVTMVKVTGQEVEAARP